MKTIFKSFIYNLWRSKIATVLNVLGLIIGFVVFIVIIQEVLYEFGYDKFHPQAEQIYRVESKWGRNKEKYRAASYLEEFKRITDLSSQIKVSALITDPSIQKIVYEDKTGARRVYEEKFIGITPSFTQIFDFNILTGEASAIEDPSTLLIPESMARKIFNRIDIVGEQFEGVEENFFGKIIKKNYNIGGVFKDFPTNSIVRNCIYVKNGENVSVGNMYVLLDHSSSQKHIADMINSGAVLDDLKEPNSARLNPLTDIYFCRDVFKTGEPAGNKKMTFIFMAVALVVMAISVINFVNFTVALTPLKIKSINTRKMLGSTLWSLRLAMIGEAIVLALFSFGLALGIVFGIRVLGFNSYLNVDTFIDLQSVAWLAGMALLTGITAGVFPAFYATSFPTALVLKGSFALSSKGKRVRTLLVGFQYVVSLALIIVSCFMNLQYDMMSHRDLGFDKDQVMVVKITKSLFDKRTVFQNILKQNIAIKHIAVTSEPFFSENPPTTNNEKISFNTISVTSDFIQTLGLKVTEGRDFTELDDQKVSHTLIILNQKAKKEWNVKLGDRPITNFELEVVGFVEDFNYRSLYYEQAPFALRMIGSGGMARNPYVYLKINSADYYTLVKEIHACAKSLDPNFIPNVSFLDDVVNQAYKKDKNQTSLITFFSIVSIVLSLVGVFGLVFFETGCRKKEISLRKVMGATIVEILVMFNRTFVKVVAVCFVIAAPVAYYATTQWLGGFAYRTPLYAWVFAGALLVVILITVLTVTYQSYRAATANPVDAIKTE